MRKKSTHQSGLFTLRFASSLALIILGCSLGYISYAANPTGATITPSTATALTWVGTADGIPPATNGESDCTGNEGHSCDSYTLTISGVPSDWLGKQVHVQIVWGLPTTDYDLYVHQGSLAGPVVASSANGGTTIEQVDLNPSNPSVGTGVFVVHVVYYLPNSQDQYQGAASVKSAGAPPLPAPTPTAPVFAPRFENYNPPAAGPNTLGLHSGEPSIGVALPIAGHPEGRAMFQSDVQTLRVTFNGCTFPRALWENVPAPTSAQDFDPILFTDLTTGRTIVSLLSFAGDPVVPQMSYTDTAPPFNDGDTYVPITGTRPGSGIDHQTVGGGPYNPTAPPPVHIYQDAIYYCSQALVDASCARSDDGGQTYTPAFPTYTSECGGLHGHVKVAPDGTVYLPNKGCGGQQAAVVSEDNGVTWAIRPVPGSTSGGSDPSVAVDQGNKVYFGYADGDTKAVVTTSTDHGQNWSQPYDVGAIFGINNVAYPAFIAGSPGRATMAFFGTPTPGGLQGSAFAGVWHLYVATTYDGGAHWSTVDATPNDAIQRGCIWQGGGANVCRNLLDFFDVTMDHEGRIVVGYDDGCAGAECAQAPGSAAGNSYTALAAIARQSGGLRLLSSFDSATDVGTKVPGTPSVTALRNGGVVHLSWSEADNGGLPITAFKIYRSTSSGMETLLASVGGAQLTFDDASAIDPAVTYYYQVQAINSQGSSCKENEVSARYVGDSHSGTGYVVAEDPTGATDGAAQAANPDLDIQTLSILEPGSGAYAGKIVFNLKMVDLSTIPDQRMWRIVWNDPHSPDQEFYVGMTKNGTVTFEYGTVITTTTALVLGTPNTNMLGTPDFGTYDPATGLITIVVSKDKIGNPQIGDLFGAFSVRTYANVSTLIRSTGSIDTTSNATANDITANTSTYALVGSVPDIVSAASVKTHGTTVYPVSLIPPPNTYPVGIECRQGKPSGKDFTVVVTFAVPINSVSGASVSSKDGLATTDAPTVATVGGQGVVTVNLHNVNNAQIIGVNLLGVNDGTNLGNLSVPMGVLLGDVTSSGHVDSGDVSSIRRQNGKPVTNLNFRNDVTINNHIDAGDAALARRKNGTGF